MKYLVIFLSFCFVLLSFTSVEQGFFSIILFYGFYFAIGKVIINFITPNYYRQELTDMFSIIYSVYIIYMVITNLVYVQDPLKDFFVYSDQCTIYNVSVELSKSSNLSIIYDRASDFWVGIYKNTNAIGANFLFGLIGFIANLFGGNNIIIQKLSIVFFASVVPIFIFLILITRINLKSAKKASYFFAFCLFNFFYSALLLRDIHILLLYTIAMYIIVKRYTMKNFFMLFVLLIISYSFRTLSGFFFLIFIFAYLFLNINQPKIKFLAVFTLLFSIIFLYTYIDLVRVISDSFAYANNFQDYSINKLGSGALRLKLEALPIGIKEIAKASFSQIQPFPFWGFLFSHGYPPNERNLFRVTEAIAGLFWIYVWVFAIYGLYFKNEIKTIPKSMKWLFYIAVLLIFLNIVEYSTRRIMIVYPAIFFIASLSFFGTSKGIRRNIINYTTIGYFFMNIIYILITIR